MGDGRLLVEFWDVGQGDCSVIHLPTGELILIDVGPLGSPLVDWLSCQPGRRIHSIVITHNHADHVGALSSLVHCCSRRIGTLYLLDHSHIKESGFHALFRAAEEARKTGGIQDIRRLEAPQTLWRDSETGVTLGVRHPTMSGNVLSRTPNETSAVLALTVPQSETILWAGDTTIANIAAVASEEIPAFMLGPHHGAPEDRQHPQFPANLSAIGPRTIVASVGSHNSYRHPAVSYIKHARRIGARFCCTQVTKNCEKPSRLHHVYKGAALLGLPQASTGFSCRGTIRLSFDGERFAADPLAERQHVDGLNKLTKPKCLRYGS